MNQNHTKTALMAARQKLNDGLLSLLPEFLIKLICTLPLLFLWQAIAESGNAGMSLDSMRTYTYATILLGEQLNVRTFASSWNSDGAIGRLFLRPMGIFGAIIAQTVGGWLPELLLFSLPLALLAPCFGISLLPQSLFFFPSLLLCITLGFALDLLFACLAVYLRVPWLSYVIRSAVTTVFSGSVIPFALLPDTVSTFFRLQPFGSLAAAPLSLLSGSANAKTVLLLQLFWNLVLWPAAFAVFAKSRERLVSFGG